MAHIIAQHTLNHVSGVPENVVTNTFHFVTAAPVPTAGELDAIVAALKTFFDTNVGTGSNIMVMLSLFVNPNNRTIKLYNAADPKPRLPLRVDVSNAPSQGAGSFPGEVALVLSFRSSTPSGVPLRRRRGRIYLGPLSDSTTLVTRTGGDVRPSLMARQTVVQAAARMMNDPSVDWATFSTVDGQTSNVLSGFVDDSYDTQRRRGTAATTRTVFP